MAEQFVRQSVDLTVITRHIIVDSRREDRLFGARVIRIPPSGGTAGALRWPMMITAFLWLVKERRNFDIIFVDGFLALGVPAVLMCKLFGKRVVFKSENIGEMSGAFFDGRLNKVGLSHCHWLIKPLIALRNGILRRADVFCPITTDTTIELLQAGIDRNKIRPIPNAYDSSKFLPASPDERITLRKKYSIDPKRTVGIFTGRLNSMKGPQHLVRIWREIVEADNNHPLLLVVGPDSYGMFDCGHEIRDYIRTHHLGDDILMTGGVRNVEEYLRLSDFYCFPSQGGEGLPTSVIEAMGCGLPVITTRTTGLTDVVTPETGVAVERTDFEGFKTAIVRLLRDERLRITLGRAAAERARKMYAADRVHQEYVQIFRSLLAYNDQGQRQ